MCSWPSKYDNSSCKSWVFGGLCILFIIFSKSVHHVVTIPPRRGLLLYHVICKSSGFDGKLQNTTSWEWVLSSFFPWSKSLTSSFLLPFCSEHVFYHYNTSYNRLSTFCFIMGTKRAKKLRYDVKYMYRHAHIKTPQT